MMKRSKISGRHWKGYNKRKESRKFQEESNYLNNSNKRARNKADFHR